MKNVSNEFNTAISAPSRMCKMRVTFDISDTTANEDILSITTTSQSSISDKQQLVNKKRDISYKLATFEKDRLLLDGSFVIPDSSSEGNGEIGWWSDNLCDANNSFIPSEDIIIDFNNVHSSMGITITFDAVNNEYATDFNIIVYDNIDNIIDTINVTNNTLSRFVIETQLYLYKKIEINIKKWSKPYHRAKILEVDFGVVRIYEDNNLIKASLIEEVDLTSANIPTSEFKFTVDNSNKEFNILNPAGFYKFLQERQQVVTEIGLDLGGYFEYVKTGTFYLKDWQSDEDSLTATFTARNILDLLDSYTYENLTSRSITLYALAEEILQLSNIANYEIDNELLNVSTTGLVRKTSCRNVLQMIAIAGRSNIYVLDDKVIIKHINIDLNTATSDVLIDKDNMYKEPKINLDTLIKQADVYYYTDIDTKVLKTSVNSAAVNGNILKLENNTLISSELVAHEVGEWIIDRRNLRAIYNANWRQNPAIDLLDIANIESTYETKKAIITKQEYEYNGYLVGKSELRGLIDIVD